MAEATGEQPTAHVVFSLEVDEDGWPPVGSERVWAYDVGNGRYRIDNVAWFVPDLAVGDIVVAREPDPDQHPVFERIESRSDHVTVRLIVFRQGPMEGRLERAVEAFAGLGVWAEGIAQYGMVALDIPPHADLRRIHELLCQGADDGLWEWEEGRVTQAWSYRQGAPSPAQEGWQVVDPLRSSRGSGPPPRWHRARIRSFGHMG